MKNTRIILALLLVFSLVIGGMIGHLSRLQASLINSSALSTAELYSVALTQFRALYSSEVVAKAKVLGLDITHDYKNHHNAIPLPVTLSMQLAKKISDYTSGAKVNLYSPYPYPWRVKERDNQVTQFESDAWVYLLKNPTKSYSRFEKTKGDAVLRYATADIMEPQCVACHNSHEDSPKKNWKVGDVRGVLSISLPLNDIILHAEESLKKTSMVYALVGFFMALIIGVIIIRLRQQSKTLQAHVAERTAELFNAKQVAEKANLAKTEFLSRMSHELRTPLNAILGFAQILELDAEKLNDAQQGSVQEIIDAGQHLLELINEVLDLAKIESGKLDVSIEKVVVDDVVHESITLIQTQAALRHIEVVDNISGKGLSILADRIRFKQVLVNLLSNAVKYNHESGRIILDSELIIDNQCLRIHVTDSGDGLSAEDIGKLFVSFERLDKVNNVEGAGVGLVISKHLVELMGGRIGVESTLGKGCTFWIELPVDLSGD